MKEFTTFEFECVQKSKEQKNSKQRSYSSVFENQKNERIQKCDLFSYYGFKMESGKLKSYTLAFKKRVLIRLEENDNKMEFRI